MSSDPTRSADASAPIVFPSTANAAPAFSPPWLVVDWAVPAHVRAVTTTRVGGVSRAPYGLADADGGLNLGAHCGDDPVAVAANRACLRRALPEEPVWLEQVHGIEVWDADAPTPASPPVADAAVTSTPGRVLAIMTADCLPVFFCNRRGNRVGLAHAGWRGLAHGVLESTLQQLRRRDPTDSDWLAWMGPAIGPAAFEVGDDVRNVFCAQHSQAAEAFVPSGIPGKWRADLYRLARQRLTRAGVTDIGGGTHCTVTDATCFYSFRRDRRTGRMASLIWLQP